jgi:hypothetical protein
MDTFERQLVQLINEFNMEAVSNTPDFILAQYLKSCLDAWNTGVRQRETWCGRNAAPSVSGELFRE